MIDPQSQSDLRRSIAARMKADRVLLDGLREEIRPLRVGVRLLKERTATAISLVGTDGGNNRLQFDPFLVQLVRVVDSSNREYSLEAVTPATSVAELSRAQFRTTDDRPTVLGELMRYLRVNRLDELSPMIRGNDSGRPVSPSWVQVYMELVEWAALFSLVRTRDYGSDVLIVRDGLLRSKVFAGDLFARYLIGLQEGIDDQMRKSRRRVYLVGVAKHSKVLDRYRLAMALEDVLTTDYAAFVEVPRHLEEKAYVWAEYARGNDREIESREVNKFVGGKMFFVKFGSGRRDPIWPIDIYLSQSREAQTVLGFMLNDAKNGFPVPFYPLCLQRAHENAALVDFDLDVLQDDVFDGIRDALGDEAGVLDMFRLQEADPAQARYG